MLKPERTLERSQRLEGNASVNLVERLVVVRLKSVCDPKPTLRQGPTMALLGRTSLIIEGVSIPLNSRQQSAYHPGNCRLCYVVTAEPGCRFGIIFQPRAIPVNPAILSRSVT